VIRLEVIMGHSVQCSCNLKLRGKVRYFYCYYDRNIKMSRFPIENNDMCIWLLLLVRLSLGCWLYTR
jgi:hypothetical protein